MACFCIICVYTIILDTLLFRIRVQKGLFDLRLEVLVLLSYWSDLFAQDADVALSPNHEWNEAGLLNGVICRISLSGLRGCRLERVASSWIWLLAGFLLRCSHCYSIISISRSQSLELFLFIGVLKFIIDIQTICLTFIYTFLISMSFISGLTQNVVEIVLDPEHV